MNSLRRRQEESWNLLGALGWPQDVGAVVGEPGGAAISYAEYVASLAPLLWLRLRETSGSPVNSGSGALTIAQANCTQGQTGKWGANEAYDFNGTTSLITVTNAAAIQGLTAFTLMALVKMDTLGESNLGAFFTKNVDLFQFSGASNRIQFTTDYATTDATGAFTGFTLGVWATLVARIDTDKVPYLFYNGAEVTYSTRTTGVDARVSSTVDMVVGNNTASNRTSDGLIDEFLFFDRVVTNAEILQWHTLTGAP